MIKEQSVINYFKYPDNYINNNPIIEIRREIILDMLGKLSHKQILDIGCGDGSISIPYINDNKICFLDLTSSMLDLVNELVPQEYKKNATFENISILEYTPGFKYDIILCIGVLAHIPNERQLFQKIDELLADEGILIFQYSNSSNWISAVNRLKKFLFVKNKYLYKVNRQNSKKINNILTERNFHIINHQRYWPISPFFSFLTLKLKRKTILYFSRSAIFSSIGSENIVLVKR